ncbi:MAG: NADH-quinone oxidoreductase subunit J [Dehalococcoidia bacterium]
METGVAIAFWILAVVGVASALAVVLLENIFRAALFLVLSFLTVAGFFILLQADFLAAAQILIYAGAISILLIFAILMTKEIQRGNPSNQFQWPTVVFAGLILTAIIVATLTTNWTIAEEEGKARALFGDDAERNLQELLEPAASARVQALLGDGYQDVLLAVFGGDTDRSLSEGFNENPKPVLSTLAERGEMGRISDVILGDDAQKSYNDLVAESSEVDVDSIYGADSIRLIFGNVGDRTLEEVFLGYPTSTEQVVDGEEKPLALFDEEDLDKNLDKLLDEPSAGRMQALLGKDFEAVLKTAFVGDTGRSLREAYSDNPEPILRALKETRVLNLMDQAFKPPEITTSKLADSLFNQFLLPFEVAALLLLAAILGAIVIAKEARA